MDTSKISRILILSGIFHLQLLSCFSVPIDKPVIFPVPAEIQVQDGKFTIDKSTYILVPEIAGKTDHFLSNLLSNEFSDKYEQVVAIAARKTYNEKEKFILVGDVSNPFVSKYCTEKGLMSDLKKLGDEGYILSVTPDKVVVAANNKNGALFGLESLRQIIGNEEGQLVIPRMIVKDSPKFAFRGIKLYLPGRENIPFFKRFIRDFVAYYKFNKIILELNANMRLERHPELNIGAVRFRRHLDFSRLDRPPGQHMEYQNSSHQDNADGGILEKEEVADLVAYVRKFGIEVIPELPSLTHAYYLLSGHEDLAENMNQPVPDTYCPLKLGSYKLYFEVLDEYIAVIHPSVIHIGHDEWRMEKDLCELCRGKDYGELYAADVVKIHDYLAKKGIKIALWGDHLLESVTQKEFQLWKSSAGYQYKIPGALRPEQVFKLIPKDILVFNWFWDEINNDKQVADFGFKQVYGNLRPDIDKWTERYIIKGVLGGAPSSWAATTEFNFGKDQVLDFLGCANLLWSKQYLTVDKLATITDALIGDIYYRFSGKKLPSAAGSKVKTVNITASCNSPLKEGVNNLNVSNIKPGIIKKGNLEFDLGSSAGNEMKAIVVETRKNMEAPVPVNGIKINEDVNSIIFLHACANEANNKKAYDAIYNFNETAELLGWYEVVYEDGFIVTIPVRYGVNILDWRWEQRTAALEKPKAKYSQNQYAYQASSVSCSKESAQPVTFFSFEWENPRFGKQIKEINLKPVNYGKNNENAIILLAVSVTENTKKTQSKGTERI